MAIKFLSDIDDSQNKTIQFVIEDLLTAPSNPVKGQFYFNRNENAIYWYNGSKWIDLNGLSFEQVNTLPTTGEEGIIYLVPVTGEDYNYEKYFYYDNNWEPLGSASKTVIIDNLTSTSTEAALSANQGKVLSELKISSTDDTVDNIITLSKEEYNTLKTNNQLQEKTLYNIIDDTTSGGGSSVVVIDNLTSTSTTDALSANQGKVLKGLVDNKANTSDIPDVSNFITATDYATGSVGGVIKLNSNYATSITSGILRGLSKTLSQYDSGSDYMFISKGTLDNVITGKLYQKNNTTDTEQLLLDTCYTKGFITQEDALRLFKMYYPEYFETSLYSNGFNFIKLEFNGRPGSTDLQYVLNVYDEDTTAYIGTYKLYKYVKETPRYDTTMVMGRDFEEGAITNVFGNYSGDGDNFTIGIDAVVYNKGGIISNIKIYDGNVQNNKLLKTITNPTATEQLTISEVISTTYSDYYTVINPYLQITYSDNTILKVMYINQYTDFGYKPMRASVELTKGGLACLIGDTLVNTEEGTKYIKDIKVGDKVLSYNKKTNKTQYKEVNNVYSHYTNLLFKIQTNKDLITCTYDEPFTTVEGYRVQACSLVKGAKLFTTEDKEIVINKIDTFKNIEPRVLVYDISVKDNYNYFITKNKILVNTEDTTKKED